MLHISNFNFSLLHPRYWLIWIGIIILYLLVLLPYPIIYFFGKKLGKIVHCFMQDRINIIKRNLQLCFPHLTHTERTKLLKQNCESISMGIFETGMAWFWPNWRIKRWCKINGLYHISKARKKNSGILLIGIHFLTLELGARILGIVNPGIGVYRPNNNPLIDWLQTWGRLRSNKLLLNRKNIKGIIRSLKNQEIIWYAPDHDYGPKSSIFVPLFSVPYAATTVGTYTLIKMTNPAIIPFIPRRLSKAAGYEVLILPNEENIPLDNKSATITYINKIIEKIILLAPEQYMWMHRRFKTRPQGKQYLYK